MSQARDFADSFSAVSTGRRNLIINGAMQVWQRGTSSSGALSNAYATADRWNFNTRSCTTRNISQQSFTVGQTDVTGNPDYFLRGEFSNDSGSTGPYIMQRIEGVSTGSGQTLSFSFYAKADATQTITPKISQQFGSGGSTAVDVSSTPSTISVGTNWQKYTVTFDVPSISGKTIGTNNYLRVDFRLPANTAITFDVALVQLELGNSASPFEHRSYGEELALCQKKKKKITGYLLWSSNSGSGTHYGTIEFKQTKRTTPSFSSHADTVATTFDLNADSHCVSRASYNPNVRNPVYDAEL